MPSYTNKAINTNEMQKWRNAINPDSVSQLTNLVNQKANQSDLITTNENVNVLTSNLADITTNITYVKTTDDLQTILNNAQKYDTILLQEGEYSITEPLLLSSKAYVMIKAEGYATLSMNASGDLLTLDNSTGITFENIQFFSGSVNDGSGVVLQNNSNRVMFKNCYFYNFYKYCLDTVNSFWLSTKDCIFDKGEQSGYSVVRHGSNSNNMYHSHSRFVSKNSSTNILITSGMNITISSCDISSDGTSLGIDVSGSGCTNIVNNYFENVLTGIRIGNTIFTAGLQITGNYMNLEWVSGKVGINLVSGANIKIDANYFLGQNPTYTSTAISIADTNVVTGVEITETNYYNTITTKVSDTNRRATYNSRKKRFGTQAPTIDTWQQGDIVWNLVTQELGSTGSKYVIVGWACSLGGTPGTWVPMRVITGN